MADRKKEPAEPFQLWREWLDRSERQLNATFNDLMGTEAYAAASGRWMEMFLAYQGTLNQATERYFSALNLPTKSGMTEIADRLSSIEQRLEGLEQAVSTLAGPAVQSSARKTRSSVPRPPRTKRAPTKQSVREGVAKSPAGKPKAGGDSGH